MVAGPLSSRELAGHHEFLAVGLCHWEPRRHLGPYELKADELALARKPVLGVLAMRGRNEIVLKNVRGKASGSEVLTPLLRAYRASDLEARVEGLQMVFPRTRISLKARTGRLRGSLLTLRDGEIALVNSTKSFSLAHYHEDSGLLELEGGDRMTLHR